MGWPPPSPPVVHINPNDASVGVGSNRSSIYLAVIEGGLIATLKFYYDGNLKQQTTGNSAIYSTPASDSVTAGNHTIRVVAINDGGSSEDFAMWHVVSADCIPYDDRIQFA